MRDSGTESDEGNAELEALETGVCFSKLDFNDFLVY